MARIPVVRCVSKDIQVSKLVLEARWLLPDKWRLHWQLQSNPNVVGSTCFIAGCSSHQITAEGHEIVFDVSWRSDLRRALWHRPQSEAQREFVTPASVLCLADAHAQPELVDAG
ncbi:MAG: hypothetical protein AAF098_17960 [Pseudomonadota bacterium]